jgi:hypothetical protein
VWLEYTKDGGFEVPKYTSYVTVSSGSGSDADQLNVGVRETPVAKLLGEKLVKSGG